MSRCDIDAQVNELLDRLNGTETDAELVERLCAQAPLLREIAHACEQTALYQRATPQVEAFIAAMQQDCPPEDRLLCAWLHFLDRVINARNVLFRLGAVRVCIPLVALYLPPPEAGAA